MENNKQQQDQDNNQQKKQDHQRQAQQGQNLGQQDQSMEDNTQPMPDNTTGGSMSEGNLSNSRYDRDKSTNIHEKTTIMGSDDDGQAG